MKNKHIELVKKWLADNDSVSHVELVANADAAYAVSAADAYAAAAAADAYAAAAADAAADACSDDTKASYWVKRYEELTK